tara:strand:+ start:501 stop:959 length:459 start_codon:yes stop_codon:yes gene_type:complete
MRLQDSLINAMKTAMKSKDTTALTALRSIKSAILLIQTQGGSNIEISQSDEIKLLQKLVKQRNDSAEIYTKQNRPDLAAIEIDEVKIISQFLPEMLSESDVENFVIKAIDDLGANSMKDMGKVMAYLNQELSGKSDGKTISTLVKKHLMSKK